MTLHRRSFASLLILLVGLGPSAIAQSDVVPQTVLELCWTQMGGRNLTAGDAVATGSVSYPDGKTADLKIKTRGEAVRIEERRDGREEAMVGGKGKSFFSKDGEKRKFRYGASAHFRPEFLPLLNCRLSGFRNLQAEVVALEGGIQHLRIASKVDGDGGAIEAVLSEYHVFIDMASGRITKLRNFVFSPGFIENRSVWEVRYSDYHDVNGVLVPFRYERYIDGALHSTVTLDSVNLDEISNQAEFE
jgi:hypothetical protein